MRSGTTALAHFLVQLPDIYVAPAKETHFFDDPDFDDSDSPAEIARRYAAHFPNFAGQPLVGEATPIYMYFPKVIDRLARYNPDMKIILLLREPVSRALSHYRHARVHQVEKRSLAAALLLEKIRLWRDRNNVTWTSSLRRHSYVDRGFYGRQLANLLKHFPARQICVVHTPDLRDRHASTLRTITLFLGLAETTAAPTPEFLNVFGEPAIPDCLRAGLKLLYKRDQQQLAKLLDSHRVLSQS